MMERINLENIAEDDGALFLFDLPEAPTRNDAQALAGEALRLEAQAAASLRLMGRLLWQEGDAIDVNMTAPATRAEVAAFCDLMGRIVGACEDAQTRAACAIDDIEAEEATEHDKSNPL